MKLTVIVDSSWNSISSQLQTSRKGENCNIYDLWEQFKGEWWLSPDSGSTESLDATDSSLLSSLSEDEQY